MDRLQDKDIREVQKRQTVILAICGGLMIALVLLVTSIWAADSARKGTRQAVNRVSEFYLKELAERRSQVVAEELKDHFTYMEKSFYFFIYSSDRLYFSFLVYRPSNCNCLIYWHISKARE